MLHRKYAIPVALAAIAIATVFAFAPASAAVSVGSRAPSFKITADDGKSVGLADLSGKPTLIVFWASWCPHCRAELPVAEKMYRELGPKGVNMIGISLDSDTSAGKKFARDNQVTFPMAYVGPGSDMVRSYGITGIPALFVLDKDGVVKARYAGEVSEATLRGELAKLGVK